MGLGAVLIIVVSAVIIGIVTSVRAKALSKKDLDDFNNTIRQYEENNSKYEEDTNND